MLLSALLAVLCIFFGAGWLFARSEERRIYRWHDREVRAAREDGFGHGYAAGYRTGREEGENDVRADMRGEPRLPPSFQG